jgi:excisionase family DNA binding protein
MTMNGTMDGDNVGSERYSVPQAARRLGISERAVQILIEAGTLAAERDGSHWVVLLAAPESAELGAGAAQSAGSSTSIDSEFRVTPSEIEQAIAHTAASYAADMRTMFDEVGRLYHAHLTAKDESIAELRRRAERAEIGHEVARLERDQIQAEFDALQNRLRDVEDMAFASPDQTPDRSQRDRRTRRKPRQTKWWLRLFGIDE